MSDFNGEVLARLRASASARPILDALEGEPDVWVVGGAVRDALLGRAFAELDFVVEGDAGPVARRVAARLGGTVLEHDRFGTATVASPAGIFDLTSARRETYAAPGALPDVQLGASIQEDLARRDFSVNAMAVRLSDAEAEIWPGALDDLRAGVLRVLHERSFLDDPTRLVRLCRYASRLGFAASEKTAGLAAAAIETGAPATVSGSRLGEELRRLLREPQPEGVQALGSLGLGDALFGAGWAVLPGTLLEARFLLAGEGSYAAVVLASCVLGVSVGELSARLDDLAFPAVERDAVVRAAERAPGLAVALEDVGADSELHFLLRSEGVETVALAGALSEEPGRAAAERWLRSLRGVTLAIDGHDLVAAGLSGPAVGAALDRALAARLDGSAPDRDSQLAAALSAG